MEGYLEVKEPAKWVIHWVVVRGSQLFFFKDSNTQNTENIKGHVDIGPSSTFNGGKKSKGKFEFEIKGEQGKKYLFRVGSEPLRLQWIHSLRLAAKGKSTPPQLGLLEETGEKKKVSNQYSEVPILTCSIKPDICEVTDQEMHKMFGKKHNSFGSHCKKLWRSKSSKSFDREESRQPVSEGTEATPEPFYDTFPDEKPAWYFGKLTREQSEEMLQKYGAGRFLVRDSESVNKPGAYTLSLKHRDRCRHHKIETLPDGNLVIKQHEDKPFPNLAMLMKYFVKSQEKDITLLPVICEEKQERSESPSDPPIPPKPYEKMDKRPPVIGCEDQQFTENSNGATSPRHPHGYENLPNKQRAHPPSLRKRQTEPVIHPYQNIPAPKTESTMASQSPPLPEEQASYEKMECKGFSSDPRFEEPKPSLPPRKSSETVQTRHGYENLPDKGLPPIEPTGEGYVNLPPKPRSLSDAPELPPRAPKQSKLGYENLPSNPRALPQTFASYQNVTQQAASRYPTGNVSPTKRDPPQMKRASTLPPHILQNTLGQMSINEGPY